MKLWQFYALLGAIYLAPIPDSSSWMGNFIASGSFIVVSIYLLFKGETK